MNAEKIIQYFESRDSHKIWKASCEVIKFSHNKEKIKTAHKSYNGYRE